MDITIDNFDAWQEKAAGKNVLYLASARGMEALCFSPLADPVSSCRWNPLSEVRVGTKWEYEDAQRIASSLFSPVGNSNADAVEILTAFHLLTAAMLHLLYKHQKEHLPVPTLGNVASFLHRNQEDVLREMRNYAHISEDTFVPPSSVVSAFAESLPKPGPEERSMRPRYRHRAMRPERVEPEPSCKVDLSSWKQPRNILQEVYGEYVDFHEEPWQDMGISSFEDIPQALVRLQAKGQRIIWPAEEDGMPSGQPWHLLLTHPKVRACAQSLMDCYGSLPSKAFLFLDGILSFFDHPMLHENMSRPTFGIRESGKHLPAIFMSYRDCCSYSIHEALFRLFLSTYYELALSDCRLVKQEETDKASDSLAFPEFSSSEWYEPISGSDSNFSLMVDPLSDSCVRVRLVHRWGIKNYLFSPRERR